MFSKYALAKAVFIYVSVSHLHRMASTKYCQCWLAQLAGHNVLPLTICMLGFAATC